MEPAASGKIRAWISMAYMIGAEGWLDPDTGTLVLGLSQYVIASCVE